MISIEEVKSTLQVPSDGIGFVVMQPHLSGRVNTRQEPFKWLDDERAGQLDRIRTTLQISLENLHDCEKTHFTIFPEYALPGFEAVNIVDSFLGKDSWPCGTVVVGGLDGLTKDEYATLCGMDRVSFCECNGPQNVLNGQWVNCCITWEKESTSGGFRINKLVQAKMRPSSDEEFVKAKDMFCGKGVYVVKGSWTQGPAFRFLTTICYDWIGVIENEEGILSVLSSLERLWSAGTDPKMLDLVLLIQCNKKPNNPAFLGNAFRFFDKAYFPFVSRDNAVVAMLNTAKSEKPACCKGEPFGSTSLVFSPNPHEYDYDPPTYAVNTGALRDSSSLRNCRDALFREAGECVHSFSLIHPRFVGRETQYSRLPIRRAVVSPLCSSTNDPRMANAPIAASTKWVNDHLDKIDCPESVVAVIKTLLSGSYALFENSLRYKEDDYLSTSISLATERESDVGIQDNCDLWESDEIRVLETWSAVASLIGCISKVNLGQGTVHGVFKREKDFVEIVIVVGDKHCSNIQWADRQFPPTMKHKRLIISRDRGDGADVVDRERPVYDVPGDTVNRTFHSLMGVLSAADKKEFLSRVSECIGAP